MEVHELWTYPIKSLRGFRIDHGELTPHGFPYDRRFMLLKVPKDGKPASADAPYQNMAVSDFPGMCLFTTALDEPSKSHPEGRIRVTYTDPEDRSTRTLEIPLEPSTDGLRSVKINMHSSRTTALRMPDSYCNWFSACFGFSVLLAYLGSSYRPVLGTLAPNAKTANPVKQLQQSKRGSWLGSLTKLIGLEEDAAKDDYGITFADVAPYLFASTTSLDDVSRRLPNGQKMDISKFRANIIVSGAETAWEEDFWGELLIAPGSLSSPSDSLVPSLSSPSSVETASMIGDMSRRPVNIHLTGNCGRCASVNVDFNTGRAEHQVLKLLQSDRRVDAGIKYTPIFGRYGFVTKLSQDLLSGISASVNKNPVIKVGDRVQVVQKNEERTVFCWPGDGGTAKDNLYPVF